VKRWQMICAICIAILVPVFTWVNPIIRRPFNEFMFTPTGWVMEMGPTLPSNFDGWSLTSKSDTAYFKDGITGSFFMIITPDSLKSRLVFSHLWERISICDPKKNEVGFVTYGKTQYSEIPAPTVSRSIAYHELSHFFYLDNSPTLGLPNDALNAMGTVNGVVTDSAGLPLRNVQVTDWDWTMTLYTDSAGHFEFTDYARRLSLSFYHPSYTSVYLPVQVWPESTVNLAVMMDPVVSVTERITERPPLTYRLNQNYPNPFNPSTTFELAIPREGEVSLIVYDVKGVEVERILSARLRQGTYRVTWSPEYIAAGVYFCRMIAGKYQETRKMVMIR